MGVGVRVGIRVRVRVRVGVGVRVRVGFRVSCHTSTSYGSVCGGSTCAPEMEGDLVRWREI